MSSGAIDAVTPGHFVRRGTGAVTRWITAQATSAQDSSTASTSQGRGFPRRAMPRPCGGVDLGLLHADAGSTLPPGRSIDEPTPPDSSFLACHEIPVTRPDGEIRIEPATPVDMVEIAAGTNVDPQPMTLKTLARAAAMANAGLMLAACIRISEPDAARVDCGKPGPHGVACKIQRTAGNGGFEACWELVISCRNKGGMNGGACHEVAPGQGAASETMPSG